MPAIHSETKRAYVERGLHADIAGRAGPVLNDKLLSQMIRQVVADDARDDVVGAAGRKRDDPAHRPRRIGLRPRDARDARQHGSACGQTEKISAGKFHFAPPFASHHSITSSAGASKPRTQLTPGRRHDAVLGFGLVSATSRPYGTRAYKRTDEVSTPSNSLASLRSRVSKPSLNQP